MIQPDEKPDGLLPQMLHPAYWDWVKRPGEMLGFWLWTGPDTMRDISARTGANATSFHTPMWLVEDDKAPLGVKAVPAARQIDGWGLASSVLNELGISAGIDIGEHNNACFVHYADWFWAKHPNSAMRDINGRIVKSGDNIWPAMNDPVLTELGREQMTDMGRLLKDEKWVRYWVLGGEQGYPDYFGHLAGDYRPAARRHYRLWQIHSGLPTTPRFGEPQWNEFRESAVTDHFAGYTAHLRSQDPTRPILIPTHGNPFALDLRPKLGYSLDELAGAADGFEAGPIAIDDDAERLIRITLDQQTGFGIPVAAPRIADKRLNAAARGGGRSFSPASVRRFLYEALGLGVWHLGLVQWSGTLVDGEWGIAGTPAEAECKRVFEEMKNAAPYLDRCSRLRPQVGLFISDAAWRRRWQDRWTLLYDSAIKRGWHMMLLSDAQLGKNLAREVPVIVSVDNPVCSKETAARMKAYTGAGGRVVSVGAFAGGPAKGAISIPDNAPGKLVRIFHQTQTASGANTWPANVKPLPMDEIEKTLEKHTDLRPLEAIDKETGQRADGIELLPLTDGTGIFAIIINRTDLQREIQVKLSKPILGRLGQWTSRNTVTGEIMTRQSDTGSAVSIPPQGTAMLYIEPEVNTDAPEREIEKAQKAINSWTGIGADVQVCRGIANEAAAQLKAGRSTKAYALARIITHSLALKALAAMNKSSLHIEAKAWQPDGMKGANAKVRVRFVPGPFEWKELRETSTGVYTLDIPRRSLPQFYNASKEEYETINGLTQYVIDATCGNLKAGMRGTIDLRE